MPGEVVESRPGARRCSAAAHALHEALLRSLPRLDDLPQPGEPPAAIPGNVPSALRVARADAASIRAAGISVRGLRQPSMPPLEPCAADHSVRCLRWREHRLRRAPCRSRAGSAARGARPAQVVRDPPRRHSARSRGHVRAVDGVSFAIGRRRGARDRRRIRLRQVDDRALRAAADRADRGRVKFAGIDVAAARPARAARCSGARRRSSSRIPTARSTR